MNEQKQKSIQPQPSEEYKGLQQQFDALCNEMDLLYRTDFEKVFDNLFKIDTTLNKNFPCTENEDEIREAVLQAGFGGDEAFINDFIKYNRLFIEGKQIQKKGLEIMAQDFTELISQQEKQQSKPDEWQFVGFHIIASPELHDGINEILKDEAEHGKGLFANVTDIPLEDIDEDEFDMVEVYNCQATFTKYLAELKRFSIIGAVGDEAFLNKTFKNTLMRLLRGLATYIKENTDKQAATKNEITDTIKILDELSHWGLFLQILILQGLCRWLESVNINEGDKGFDEAQALYDWLLEHLAEKIMNLAFKPYSDGDKARLKPLTDYLYSIEIGRWVQEQIFSKPQQDDILLPDEAKELSKETPNRGKGRPSKPFDDILVKDKEATKRKLHSLIDGKQDSKAVIYIKAAIQLGVIQKPTHTQFIKEFGSIVSKQIFNKYINGNLYSDDELKGAKQALKNG